MAADKDIGSILVVDCGTVITKAMLLDQVGGKHRFVAYGEASTVRSRNASITDAIIGAVEEISRVTGRRFFDEAGELVSPEMPDGRGVDAVAATLSASEPLQVVLSGLVVDLSISSARRAAAGTYSQVNAILGGGQGVGTSDEDRVRAIRAAAPDVVFLVGGIDGGAEEPVLDATKAATLACAMMKREQRPTLLYAGNSDLRRAVAEIVGDETELRVVDNVRPTLDDEFVWAAQQELQSLYKHRKMEQLPGMNTLKGWSSVPVVPTAQALGQLIHYLWYLGDPTRGVMGIDVGGASTTVAAVFDEQLFMTVHGGLGMAFGGRHLIEEQGFEPLDRWMPESLSIHDVRALLITKETHPPSIPQVHQELRIDQAMACAAIRATLDIARPGWECGPAELLPELTPLCDTILISGVSLTRTPQPSQAALVVLNAVEPVGVTTLVWDKHGLAPALGSVAAVKPMAAVEALDAGGFTNLATVVAPVGGTADQSSPVLRVSVTYEDGGTLDVEVYDGDLEVLPLPLGQESVVEFRPAPAIDVGLGGPGQAGMRRVSGGLAGLIIDARGRPLEIPEDPELRRAKLQRWQSDVGG